MNYRIEMAARISAGESVTEGLAKKRVVSFDVCGRELLVCECCDDYFSVLLSRDQLLSLIAELQAMAGEMDESGGS